ncbi:MAG: hypothetical protein GC184_13730 [Rhizobiales bacterium]|nr:hypothetical protein [Hyphomicrobiales bacterium]
MYPRGSEWRRWDLHIHTPKSIVQQYGGDTTQAWDIFIQTLAALPSDVKVIAVTDYLFCDGYERLLTRRSEIPNIELIMPNIEFRLNTFSGTANNNKRHNFHVIFDPTVSPQTIREQLLNGLVTGYKIDDKTEWQQTPTRTSLEELGRHIKAAAPDGHAIRSKTDLMVGFDNITYDRKLIEELLSKTPFRGRYVTAVGYSEWNLSRWDQSAAEKRDLINTANFALTSVDDPAQIVAHKTELRANNLNDIILHSSDAHEFARIGKTQLWIKADPTFAGLKQVLNEPDARVFVGETPPNYKPDHKVISRIRVRESSGWFPKDFALELSRDLVTIIGGRGSGKSALAEAIAFGAGSMDPSDDAFLKKAAKHRESITNSVIELDWGDGVLTTEKVGTEFPDKGLVRYLPQGVVEELCSHQNSDVLQGQIENVIFQALDQTQRRGASNFAELKKRVLTDFQYEKDQAIRKIRYSNKRVAALIAAIKAGPDKQRTLSQQTEELTKLNSSLPELPAEDKKAQEELSGLIEWQRVFERKIVELDGRLSKVSEAETVVKVFQSRISDFQTELAPLLSELDITDSSAFAVVLNDAAIKAVFDGKRVDISNDLNVLRSGSSSDVATILACDVTELPYDNLATLNAVINEQRTATKAFETTKLKYQQQKAAASAVEQTIKALESEIAKIDAELKPELARLENERSAAYISYFEICGREKSKIEELYKPLQDSLGAGTETDKKLTFEARIGYRIEAHCRAGHDIIDRTRKGNFRDQPNLKKALGEMFEQLSRSDFDPAAIQSEIQKLLDAFTNFDGTNVEIQQQLRENCGLEEFYNWLFDPTNFEIVSSLKFEGSELYVLSPGQKGIILLMLYLEIDKADDRPLIIDQPEENLDNLSIYADLMGYFRDRKRFRQIIMVTHNPNLVVNTDAEQVVLANYDGDRSPRMVYASGSLEDHARYIPDVPVEDLEDGIIEQVCGILEGGEPAFNQRKKKYQISRKSYI